MEGKDLMLYFSDSRLTATVNLYQLLSAATTCNSMVVVLMINIELRWPRILVHH